MSIPERFSLECDDPDLQGRPCWLQEVAGSSGLYIAAQAKKPEEDGFPHVQTLLVTISADGEISEYGREEVLGVFTTGTDSLGKERRAIQWVDGTGVTWVEQA